MHLAGQTLIIWKSDAAFDGWRGVYDIGVKLLFTKTPPSFFLSCFSYSPLYIPSFDILQKSEKEDCHLSSASPVPRPESFILTPLVSSQLVMCHNGIYLFIYIYIYRFSLCCLVHKVKTLRVVVWLKSLSRLTGRGGAYAGPARWCTGVGWWLP